MRKLWILWLCLQPLPDMDSEKGGCLTSSTPKRWARKPSPGAQEKGLLQARLGNMGQMKQIAHAVCGSSLNTEIRGWKVRGLWFLLQEKSSHAGSSWIFPLISVYYNSRTHISV